MMSVPFCSFCGFRFQDTGPFCPACGRPRTPGAPATGAGVPPAGPPPPPPAQVVFAIPPQVVVIAPPPSRSRPLNLNEHAQLVKRVRSPAAAAARFVGFLAGLGSLFFAATYFLGFPYDPDSLLYILVGSMLLGLLCSGAALNIVRDPKAALKNGTVLEASGPTTSGAVHPPGHTAIVVGATTLVVPNRAVHHLPLGVPTLVVVAQGPRAMRTPGWGTHPRGLLLQVNGVAVPGAPAVYLG